MRRPRRVVLFLKEGEGSLLLLDGLLGSRRRGLYDCSDAKKASDIDYERLLVGCKQSDQSETGRLCLRGGSTTILSSSSLAIIA